MNKSNKFESFVLLVFCILSISFVPSYQTCLKKSALELKVGEEGTLITDELPFQIVNLGTKMCMEGGGVDGSEVTATYCFSGNPKYNWQRISYGSGYYAFTNEQSNLVMEAKCGDTSKDAQFREWKLTNLNNQTILMIMSGTNFQLQLMHSKKCIEIQNKRLVQNDCNASNQNQLFKQKRVTFKLPETWAHIKNSNGNCIQLEANHGTSLKACDHNNVSQLFLFNKHVEGSLYLQSQNAEVLEQVGTGLKNWDYQNSRAKRWFLNQKDETNQVLIINQEKEQCINASLQMVGCNFDDAGQLWTLMDNTVYSPIPNFFFSIDGASNHALKWNIGKQPTSEAKRAFPGLYGFRLQKNTNGTYRLNHTNGLSLYVNKVETRSPYGVLLKTTVNMLWVNDAQDDGGQSLVILPKGKDKFQFKLTGLAVTDWCTGFAVGYGFGNFFPGPCNTIYTNNISPLVVPKPPVDEPIMIKNLAANKCIGITNNDESPGLIDCTDSNAQVSFIIEYNPKNFYYYFKHYSGLTFEAEDSKVTVRRLDRNHGRHRYVLIKLDANYFAISESERESCLQMVNGAISKADCNFSNEQKFSFESSTAKGVPENWIKLKSKSNTNLCISDVNGRGNQFSLVGCKKTNDQSFMIAKQDETNLFTIQSNVGYMFEGGDAALWITLPDQGKFWQRFSLFKHQDESFSIMNPYVGGRRCLTNNNQLSFDECKFDDKQKFLFENSSITPIPTSYIQIKSRKKNKCVTQDHLYKKVYFADCVQGDLTQAYKFRKDPEGYYFVQNIGGLVIKEDWDYYISWDWWSDSGTRFIIRNIDEKYFVLLSQDRDNKPLKAYDNNNNLTQNNNNVIDVNSFEQHFEFLPFNASSPFEGESNSIMFRNKKSQKCIKFNEPYEVLKMGDCQLQNESMAIFPTNQDNRGFTLQFINNLAIDNWSWRSANWDLHKGGNQMHLFFPQRDGTWKYTSKDRINDCIMQNTDNNNPVQYTNDCNNENTKWELIPQNVSRIPKTWIMIVSVSAGKCLKRPSGNEQPVLLGDCEANKNNEDYLWLISPLGDTHYDIQDFQKKGLIPANDEKVVTRDGDFKWNFTPVSILTFQLRYMDWKKCVNFSNKTSAALSGCNLSDKNTHFVFKDPLAK